VPMINFTTTSLDIFCWWEKRLLRNGLVFISYAKSIKIVLDNHTKE